MPVALVGDFNVVPTDFDIYPTKSWNKDALLQPESRAAFQRLMKQGWVDAVRTLHPDQPMYSFWDYMRNRWQRDAGLRLDFILLSPDLAKQLASAGVDKQVRGKKNASDHAPVWATLLTKPQQRRKSASTNSVTPNRRAQKSGARPLLVIDGDSFAHRSFHALPKTILRPDGKGGGAILGFANFLLRLYKEEQPRAVLVAWDTLSSPTYRHKALPSYQSGRHFDPILVEQLERLPEFVAACGFANAKAAGFEADDFLAAIVRREERRGKAVLVASGDRDTFQLVSETTTILYPAGAGVINRIGPAEVRERYGVDPQQVPDFIALRGDPSDKIPGAPGVGSGSAAEILRKYGSLEGALKAGRFAAYKKELRLYRSIATMDRSAPLPRLWDHKPRWKDAAVLAREWGLQQLAERLEKVAQGLEKA